MPGKKIAIFGWANSVHIQRWVSGLVDRGYHIKLISLGGGKIKGCETVIFPRKGKLSYLTSASAAAREIATFQPDLLHIHYITGFGVWGLWAKKQPTLVSVWGADIVDFPNTWLRRSYIKRVLGKATHITATSQFLKDTVIKLLPTGAEKISVIPFGVTIPPEIVSPPQPKPIKLCSIKAHRPKYGIEVLLHAFAEALQTTPDITLTIAGEGDNTPQLKALAQKLGIQDKVTFPGFIPHDNIYAFLREHHIMVMPSICEEAFGVAAVEAAACGRPVIATHVGGVPEVVKHDTTGLLVPPHDSHLLADAIIKLVQNTSLREKMGIAGYHLVKALYQWRDAVDAMSSLYERLIDESKKT